MAIGQQIQDGWRKNAAKNGLQIDVGGIPPLSHFSFVYDNALVMKSLLVQLMLDHGILASTSFYAMYAHRPYHVEQYLSATDKVFAEIADAEAKGTIKGKLKGLPASSGFKRLT
jgi:hypothetical protein